jgi:pantetheine-phosphate adenylyltransferase
MKTAIYPGTFDPVTNGHLDVLERACGICSKVIIAIAEMNAKQTLFTVEERIQLIKENLPTQKNVSVTSFNCLLVDFAVEIGAEVIIRGLRAVSDFDFEFQMTQMNRHFNPDIETIFLMPTQEYFFTSSSLIKDVAGYSEKIGKFVPPNVAKALKKVSAKI